MIFINITYFSVTGGATYCAIASLRLMGLIEDNILSSCASSSLIDVSLLLDWILQVCTYELFQYKGIRSNEFVNKNMGTEVIFMSCLFLNSIQIMA